MIPNAWLDSLPAHESSDAQRWYSRLHWLIVGAVLVTVPAFYLHAAGASLDLRRLGSALYAISSLTIIGVLTVIWRVCRHRGEFLRRSLLDILIALGGLSILAGASGDWGAAEWGLRLLLVLMTFVRIVLAARRLFSPSGTLYAVALSAATLALSGFGFYWLEPTVHSYADGLWLAFVTGATVGYGDVVPTAPAARLFAAFIVLLGYALFSLVTASIAAVFVGEDEKALRREMHAEMKLLRDEVRQLREELRGHRRGRSS